MSWDTPSRPPDPRLLALLDAVDAYLSGVLSRDALQAAWKAARDPR